LGRFLSPAWSSLLRTTIQMAVNLTNRIKGLLAEEPEKSWFIPSSQGLEKGIGIKVRVNQLRLASGTRLTVGQGVPPRL
jgi:hypothetical protein